MRNGPKKKKSGPASREKGKRPKQEKVLQESLVSRWNPCFVCRLARLVATTNARSNKQQQPTKKEAEAAFLIYFIIIMPPPFCLFPLWGPLPPLCCLCCFSCAIKSSTCREGARPVTFLRLKLLSLRGCLCMGLCILWVLMVFSSVLPMSRERNLRKKTKRVERGGNGSARGRKKGERHLWRGWMYDQD